MVVVKDQLDPNLRKLIKQKKQIIAIIPVGSIEQHGPHLPISTDSDIVTEIAIRIAKKRNFLLLPTIYYGTSFEHSPFFNLSIKHSTLQKLLSELCLSLSGNGIKTIFVLNGHYTNQKAINGLSKVCKLSKGKIRIFAFSYWNFMKECFDHAGFIETSLMLAVSDNKVKMKLAKKGLITKNFKSAEISRLKKIAAKSFQKATKNGVWGDPRKASKKEGKELLSEIVKNLEKKCQTCLTGKNSKLHQ